MARDMRMYGVVLLPDRAMMSRLIQQSEQAAVQWGNSLVLCNAQDGPRPHLSLFHFRAEGGKDLQAEFRTLRHNMAPVTCRTTVLWVSGQWLFAEVTEPTGVLYEMQLVAATAFSPFNHGAQRPSWSMTAAQEASFQQWGYPSVGRDRFILGA